MLGYDVLCVGSATVDHFLNTDQSINSIKAGDKILVKGLETQTGGGATNSAVALSLLGLKVKVLTKLGQDHDADLISKDLRKCKVKNIVLHKSKKRTDSASLIFSNKDKDRIIFVHKGASADLSISDVPKRKINAKYIYLASLLGKSYNTGIKIAKLAQQKKIKLLFNPSSYLAKKGKKYLQPILSRTEILVLNKQEAQALLNSNLPTKKLLEKLQNLGPKVIVITDGKNKLYARKENSNYSATPLKVKVLQTAGAGDAFTSGLLAGIIKDYDFTEALKLGLINSQSVIQQVGAKKGLVVKKQIKQLMKKNKIKVVKLK